YIMDLAPLEELTAEVRAKDVHLCTVKPATAFTPRVPAMAAGDSNFKGTNPPVAATIYYHLKDVAPGPVTITVVGGDGKPLAKLTGPKEAGLHRVMWNLRPEGEKTELVKPGEYTATLRVADKSWTTKIRVEEPEK